MPHLALLYTAITISYHDGYRVDADAADDGPAYVVIDNVV